MMATASLNAPAGVVGDEPDAGVAVGVQRRAQPDEPPGVVAALVPAAEVVDREVVPLRAVQPRDQVVDRVVGPEPAVDPAGRRPGQAVQADAGVARLGLFGEPELIARVAVDHAAGVLDRRLGAVGGVGVPADLQLQQLQPGSVTGFEEVVQDLRLLGRRVVRQQPRVAAAAADRADAVERTAALAAVHGDGRGRGPCRSGARHDEQRGEQGQHPYRCEPHQPAAFRRSSALCWQP
jgi:hypothetical protein